MQKLKRARIDSPVCNIRERIQLSLLTGKFLKVDLQQLSFSTRSATPNFPQSSTHPTAIYLASLDKRRGFHGLALLLLMMMLMMTMITIIVRRSRAIRCIRLRIKLLTRWRNANGNSIRIIYIFHLTNSDAETGRCCRSIRLMQILLYMHIILHIHAINKGKLLMRLRINFSRATLQITNAAWYSAKLCVILQHVSSEKQENSEITKYSTRRTNV